MYQLLKSASSDLKLWIVSFRDMLT
uniref:Uncharacterized protein n=1 Tax=Arundo donax TaxID=35708 RepID=A0A0A9AJZ5_ARUDO